MHSKRHCNDWMHALQQIKLKGFSLKPYKGSYNFTTIINRLVLLMELHLYTGVGYDIIKLYSLHYVYRGHVHTHYRIYIMQNFMKKNNYPTSDDHQEYNINKTTLYLTC